MGVIPNADMFLGPVMYTYRPEGSTVNPPHTGVRTRDREGGATDLSQNAVRRINREGGNHAGKEIVLRVENIKESAARVHRQGCAPRKIRIAVGDKWLTRNRRQRTTGGIEGKGVKRFVRQRVYIVGCRIHDHRNGAAANGVGRARHRRQRSIRRIHRVYG